MPSHGTLRMEPHSESYKCKFGSLPPNPHIQSYINIAAARAVDQEFNYNFGSNLSLFGSGRGSNGRGAPVGFIWTDFQLKRSHGDPFRDQNRVAPKLASQNSALVPAAAPGGGQQKSAKVKECCSKTSFLEHAPPITGIRGNPRNPRKWCHDPLLGPSLPHALGVRMT